MGQRGTGAGKSLLGALDLDGTDKSRDGFNGIDANRQKRNCGMVSNGTSVNKK